MSFSSINESVRSYLHKTEIILILDPYLIDEDNSWILNIKQSNILENSNNGRYNICNTILDSIYSV